MKGILCLQIFCIRNLYIHILCILSLKVVLRADEDKKITLSTLKEVINKYEIVSRIDGWGWKESPVQSWSAFLTKNVMEAYENVRRYISEEEYRTVLKLANSPNRGLE